MAGVLVLAFLVLPILEIYVIIQVGQVIGAWPTVALLVLESLLGAWIVRREGRRAWRELRASVSAARVPSRELADGALILVGGTLLLTPGFVTDAAGFVLVLPPTRAIARRLLVRYVTARATRRVTSWPPRRPGSEPGGNARIVRGEVVEDDAPRREGPSEPYGRDGPAEPYGRDGPAEP